MNRGRSGPSGGTDPSRRRPSPVVKARLAAGKTVAYIRSPGQLVRHWRSSVTIRASEAVRHPVAARIRGALWSVRVWAWHVPLLSKTWDKVRPLLYRFRMRRVRVDRLLLGGWHGVSASEVGRQTDNPLFSSTRLLDSHYVELLNDADRLGDALAESDDALRGTAYYAQAKKIATLFGDNIGVSDDAGLVELTREFVLFYQGNPPPVRAGRGSANAKPFVRRIRHSDCYTIVDGHHRLAIASRSQQEVEVVLGLGSTTTTLQDTLLAMTWLEGVEQLYQPVESPELDTWVLVRNCEDRLAMMTSFLTERGLLPTTGEPRSYLDVGSCYGWFVAKMDELGFDSTGVERDPLSRVIGPMAYGLDPEQIAVEEATAFLAATAPYDVVSCFSVLHHFVLGRGPCSAEDLLGLLDQATGSVLIIETGQGHEQWLKNVLPDWNPEYITSWILENSTFNHVEALGVDTDDRPPTEGNYGRTTFACTR